MHDLTHIHLVNSMLDHTRAILQKLSHIEFSVMLLMVFLVIEDLQVLVDESHYLIFNFGWLFRMLWPFHLAMTLFVLMVWEQLCVGNECAGLV